MRTAAAPISATMLQVPMTKGWIMMKKIDVMPSGAIIRPNKTTNQGMVRQRIREPTMPVRISSR